MFPFSLLFGQAGAEVDFDSISGQNNSNQNPTEAYSGIRFNSDGTWETMQSNASSVDFSPPASSGQWLDSGAAANAWLEWETISGDWDSDPGTEGSRFQMNATRTFNINTVGASASQPQVVVVVWRAYSAASGGVLLAESGETSYIATKTPNPNP